MTARTAILPKSKAAVHYINNVSIKNNNSKKKKVRHEFQIYAFRFEKYFLASWEIWKDLQKEANCAEISGLFCYLFTSESNPIVILLRAIVFNVQIR